MQLSFEPFVFLMILNTIEDNLNGVSYCRRRADTITRDFVVNRKKRVN